MVPFEVAGRFCFPAHALPRYGQAALSLNPFRVLWVANKYRHLSKGGRPSYQLTDDFRASSCLIRQFRHTTDTRSCAASFVGLIPLQLQEGANPQAARPPRPSFSPPDPAAPSAPRPSHRTRPPPPPPYPPTRPQHSPRRSAPTRALPLPPSKPP
eukprot:451461-Prorocentrum_minimum.AAC.1